MRVLHVLTRGLIQQDERESKVLLASGVWLLGTQSQEIKTCSLILLLLILDRALECFIIVLLPLTFSISKQEPSKCCFTTRTKGITQSQQNEKQRDWTIWWALNMTLSHSQSWGVTALSTTTMGPAPCAPLTDGFTEFSEKPHTPTLIAFDHWLSPAKGQGCSTGVLTPPPAPCCCPEDLFSKSPPV